MTLHPSFCTLVVAALAAGLCPAQSPPPSGAVSIVGLTNQTQTGGAFGRQRIGAICAASFFRSAAPLGAGGVGLGGSIAWWSEALHPTTQPLTLHAAGTCFTYFMVSPFVLASVPLPFAATGFERLFESPALAVVTPAPWTQVLTSGGGAVVPPGGYDRWFLTVDIPLLPQLVGTVWSAQSVRLDGSNLQFYLSDEYIVQVWN